MRGPDPGTTGLLVLLACPPDPPLPGLTGPPNPGPATTGINGSGTIDTGPRDPWPCDADAQEDGREKWTDVLTWDFTDRTAREQGGTSNPTGPWVRTPSGGST